METSPTLFNPYRSARLHVDTFRRAVFDIPALKKERGEEGGSIELKKNLSFFLSQSGKLFVYLCPASLLFFHATPAGVGEVGVGPGPLHPGKQH